MIARRVKTNTQYGQIEQDLRSRILSGEFAGNEALPGEIPLSEEYQVSRKTIRKALENLRSQNFIRKSQGNGNFVIPENERKFMKRITGKIRLMLPDQHISDNFVREIVCGVHKFAVGSGLEISFGLHSDPPNMLIELYRNFNCDAFIWCGVPHPLPQTVAELAKLHLPQVIVDGYAQGTGRVEYDSFPAWDSLLNMFAMAGHKDLAFIERSGNMSWAIGRQNALKKAGEKYNISVNIFTAEPADETVLTEFIRSNSSIRAYVVIAPWMDAFRRAMDKLELTAPDDISYAELTPDGISPASAVTRLHLPTQNMGYEAAQMVVKHDFSANAEPAGSIACFTVAGLTVGKCKKSLESN